MKTISYLWKEINKLLDRFLNRVAVGIFFGFFLGIILFWIAQKEVSYPILFIAAAFAGVFAEIIIRFFEGTFKLKRQLKPLNRVLGTIATNDIWIYISAWRRNLNDIEHSKLYRNDPDRRDQPFIFGSEFVYGKGDALALSYINKAIEKASQGKTNIHVEDSERTYDEWNKSAICIGAHNAKTREILDKFKNTFFTFEMDYSIIIETKPNISKNDDGLEFYKTIKQKKAKDSSDIDFAIILKLRDEYHPDNNILVIAGLGDNGTAGAAYYLLNHPEKLPFENDVFGVIIKVPSGPESAIQVKFNEVSKLTEIYDPGGITHA